MTGCEQISLGQSVGARPRARRLPISSATTRLGSGTISPWPPVLRQRGQDGLAETLEQLTKGLRAGTKALPGHPGGLPPLRGGRRPNPEPRARCGPRSDPEGTGPGQRSGQPVSGPSRSCSPTCSAAASPRRRPAGPWGLPRTPIRRPSRQPTGGWRSRPTRIPLAVTGTPSSGSSQLSSC